MDDDMKTTEDNMKKGLAKANEKDADRGAREDQDIRDSRQPLGRIYRAQSREHQYFIPTALRCWNFDWLNAPGKFEIPEFLNALLMDEPHSSLPENGIDKRSVKAYYLSIRNIIQEIHNNPSLKEFAVHDTDSCSLFRDANGVDLSLKESIDEINRRFMDMARHLQTFERIKHQTPRLDFLKLSQKFQHRNFLSNDALDIREINQDKRINRFPTMCLDFSDSIAAMEKFGFITEDSAIYSVDLNKIPECLYDSYKRKCDYTISFDNVTAGINRNNNELMKDQKGYCIYWPWYYSIEELVNNKMFGFRKEKE
jgi:hypothetical protein